MDPINVGKTNAPISKAKVPEAPTAASELPQQPAPQDQFSPDHQKYNLHFISHFHWDREWYLPDTENRKGLVTAVDSVLDLMKKDPHYKFQMDGQTVALEDYLKSKPENEGVLRHYIQQGRLQVGPWYVLPDEFLADGESTVRNLMVGDKISQAFGNKMQVGYLPDTFGHNSQIPQILNGFGIDNAVIWRGVGAPPDKLKSEMNWQSPDGSKVFTLFLPYGYGNGMDVTGPSPMAVRYEWAKHDDEGHAHLELPAHKEGTTFDDPAIIAGRAAQKKDEMAQFGTTHDLLLLDGFDMSMPHYFSDQMAHDVNQAAAKDNLSISQDSLPNYIATVRGETDTGKLYTLQGEQRSQKYAPLLPGVISTRIHLKQKNVKAENLMERWFEPMATFSHQLGKAYPHAQSEECWKNLIKNHPHDDITGCGVDEVHKRDDTRFKMVEQTAGGILAEDLKAISSATDTSKLQPGQKCFVVFNTNSASSNHVAELEPRMRGPFLLRNPEGEEVPYQFSQDGKRILFNARDLPPMGYKAFTLTPTDTKPQFQGQISRGDNSMENGSRKVQINPDGTLDVTDKKTGETYRNLMAFQDGGDAGDEYNFSPPLHDKAVDSRQTPASIELVENGPVKATYRIKTHMAVPEKLDESRKKRSDKTVDCPLTSYVTLYADSPRIDVRTDFENRAQDHRLRVLFPTDIKTDHSCAESPFDVVKRPLAPETLVDKTKLDEKWIGRVPGPGGNNLSSETPVTTFPQQGFCSVSDGQKGLTILNRGLPEFEASPTPQGASLNLTLVRGVGYLSLQRDDFITRKNYGAGPTIETPGAQELGRHSFEFSILPHGGDWESANAPLHAENFISGTRVVETGRHEGELPSQMSFLSTDSKQIKMSAVKAAENGEGTIVRLFNPTDREVTTKVRSFKPITAAYATNLNEKRGPRLEVGKDNSVAVTLKGRQIATLNLV